MDKLKRAILEKGIHEREGVCGGGHLEELFQRGEQERREEVVLQQVLVQVHGQQHCLQELLVSVEVVQLDLHERGLVDHVLVLVGLQVGQHLLVVDALFVVDQAEGVF